MTGIPLNIDWQQILLHLFNFAILALGLYLLLWKPVKNFMAKREAHYAEMNDSAESALADAEALKQSYSDQLSSVDQEIQEMRENAAKNADKLAAAKLEAAEEQAAKIIANAQADAELERQKIISSARDEIVDLASIAAEKLVKQSLGEGNE